MSALMDDKMKADLNSVEEKLKKAQERRLAKLEAAEKAVTAEKEAGAGKSGGGGKGGNDKGGQSHAAHKSSTLSLV